MRGHILSYITNDYMQHDFMERLPRTNYTSASIDFMRKNGLPDARFVRMGVEGPSSRLRTMISKPISHDDLVKATAWLCSNKKAVKWFLIAGLPTESQADYDELREAVRDVKGYAKDKLNLQLSFTSFMPYPATPLGALKIDDDYFERYMDFARWFFYGGGKGDGMLLYKPSKPDVRLKLTEWALGKFGKDVYDPSISSPNLRVNYPHESARQAAIKRLVDNYGGTAR